MTTTPATVQTLDLADRLVDVIQAIRISEGRDGANLTPQATLRAQDVHRIVHAVLEVVDETATGQQVEKFGTEARCGLAAKPDASPPGRPARDRAAEAEAEVARLSGQLAAAIKAIDEHVCASVYGTVTVGSRKLILEWTRIRPGLQGRLLSFGGGENPHAWIDTRTETSG